MSLQGAICTAVLAAVAAALQLPPPLQVWRGREVALDLGIGHGAAVRLVRSIGLDESLQGGILRWRTDVAIDLQARCAPGQGADEAVDAMLCSVMLALSASLQLPATTQLTAAPLIEWDASEADETLSKTTLTLQIEHYTGPGLGAIT